MKKSLKREHLVDLCQPAHLSKEDTTIVVNSLFNVMEAWLQEEGHSISIRGICTLITVRGKFRTRYIPVDGTRRREPAKRRLRVITSSRLFK